MAVDIQLGQAESRSGSTRFVRLMRSDIRRLRQFGRRWSAVRTTRLIGRVYCAGLNSNGISRLPATGWPLRWAGWKRQ